MLGRRRTRVGLRMTPTPGATAVGAVEPFVDVTFGPEGGPYACPCCRCLTLPSRGDYELCPVCFWEDDGQDDHDADTVRGGPNGDLSLEEARTNFADFGAWHRSALSNVRPPRSHERP